MCHIDADSVAYASATAEQALQLPGSDQPIPTFAYGYTPGEARPGVVIIHDVNGANAFYRELGGRLADAGFAVLLPDLFYRQGPLSDDSREAVMVRARQLSFPVAMADLAAIISRLAGEGRKVGAVGFCMGGSLVMLAASRIPALAAGVVYYGFPLNNNPTALRPENPMDEVDQLHVPLRGFFGADDAAVGPDNVRAYAAAARAAGKAVDFTILPGVGHGFLTFDPAAPAAEASQGSWAETLAFLRTRL
ncbi:MAG TPA: dienelactone hydrolase family protein [Chloroflexia bacterium]|nr:dienelactone hydrolase family protein [Chloroflexia bacterium]